MFAVGTLVEIIETGNRLTVVEVSQDQKTVRLGVIKPSDKICNNVTGTFIFYTAIEHISVAHLRAV